MTFNRVSRQLLGWGSIAFGLWGIADPKGLTAMLGDDPDLGRQLGVRDTVVGLALLGMKGPVPAALRLASDVHDAVRLRERSPLVALGAAVIAVWDAAVLAGEWSPAVAWPVDDRSRLPPSDRGGPVTETA